MSNESQYFSTNVRDWQSILIRLESMLNVLTDLRRQLGPGGEEPHRQPALAQAMHESFIDYTLSALSRFPEVILRPISADAVWVDMPTGKNFKISDIAAPSDPNNWLQAFPDFKEEITNLVGNEEYLVIERHGTGVHQGPLRVGSEVINPTERRFDIEFADVVKIENGEAVRIDHYYDMVSVLRQLGLMPNIPLGHDERDATPLPVLHASGFLRGHREVQSSEYWPVRTGQSTISIGRSKTRTAQENMKNCLAIHEAFVNHTPERFRDLIAEDAIWIDVPTGEVLNGAAAAAHHDHGNWQTAFPDSSAEVTNLISNDEWVVVQHRGFGSHLGPLQLGGKVYEPTGRPVEIRVLDMVQYRDSKAILIRNYYDMAMMLLQLGIIPG